VGGRVSVLVCKLLATFNSPRLSTLAHASSSTESRNHIYNMFRSALEKGQEDRLVQFLSEPRLEEHKEAVASQCVDVIWLLFYTLNKAPSVGSLLTKLVEKQIVSRSLVVERLPKELAAPIAFAAPIKPDVYLQKVVRINTVTLYVLCLQSPSYSR
jgi:hypothetical protein